MAGMMSTLPANPPPHPFDTDTRLAELGGGNFSVRISDRWNTVGGRAFGGYGLAICLQALARVLPLPDPLVLSAFFLRPLRPGEGVVTAEVVRSGRSTATGEASLHHQATEALRVVATFGDLGQAIGRTHVFGKPPELPPPDDCVDLYRDAPLGPVPVSDRVECRGRALPGWHQGNPSGNPRAEFWMRFREPRQPDLFALPLLADAAAPAVFELGAAGSITLELTVHLRGHPAPGWLACRALTRYLINGYHEEDFEIWDAEGRLVAQSRQFAITRGGVA